MSTDPKPVELTEAEIQDLESTFEDWTSALVLLDDDSPLVHAVVRIVAAREAAARREALLEAREDIRARRQTFAGLGCDMQYLLAMDDCFGLVNNRLRAALAEPERDEEGGR